MLGDASRLLLSGRLQFGTRRNSRDEALRKICSRRQLAAPGARRRQSARFAMPADDVPTAAASPGPSTSEAPPPSPPVKTPKPKKTYSQVEIPTPDQLMQQEVLDSCLTRSVMAAFGGALSLPP